MLVRVFTLGFDPPTARFDDEPVRDFVSDQEVVSISDHFFIRDGTPYLALVVCYRPPASAPPITDKGSAGGSPGKRDESWRDALGKADWPLFNRLREWRGERCKAEGIPPYVICNNRQLAEVLSFPRFAWECSPRRSASRDRGEGRSAEFAIGESPSAEQIRCPHSDSRAQQHHKHRRAATPCRRPLLPRRHGDADLHFVRIDVAVISAHLY